MDGRPARSTLRLAGKGQFDQDQWELYHVDVDRSESKDLAKEQPEKLEALIKAGSKKQTRTWCCRLTIGAHWNILGIERPSEEAPRERIFTIRARLPYRKA